MGDMITKRTYVKNPATILCCAILLTFGIADVFGRGQYSRYGSTSFEESGTVIVFAIDGVKGTMSAVVLRDAIGTITGVEGSVVSHRAARATVAFDPTETSPDAIVEQLSETTPYLTIPLPAYVRAATFDVPDLETRSTGDAINEILSDLPGILGGTIRSRFISIDFDDRATDAEEILQILTEKLFLEDIEVSVPADDDQSRGETAIAVVRVPEITDHLTAAAVLDRVIDDAIMGGEMDIEQRTVTFVYAIGEITAREIELEARTAARAVFGEEIGENVVLATVDMANKPEGLNRNGWFVLTISLATLAVALVAYFVSRGARNHRTT